jgi:hypothetical protein
VEHVEEVKTQLRGEITFIHDYGTIVITRKLFAGFRILGEGMHRCSLDFALKRAKRGGSTEPRRPEAAGNSATVPEPTTVHNRSL